MRSASIIALFYLSAHSTVLFAQQAPAQAPSFVIYSYHGGPAADDVLQQCQQLREQIQKKWLGKIALEPWQPRCDIVLHATRDSYVQAIGRGGSQTSGSSLIRSDGRKITQRRIDLLVKKHHQLTALSHELTHVVLADRFGANRTPLWADEGIATFADSGSKKSLHQRDCLAALRTGTSLRLAELLHMEQFRSPHQVPAFYGQSLSLVHFLLEQGEPLKFVPFLEVATTHGYDRALRETYGIDGIARLETLWRNYAISDREPRLIPTPTLDSLNKISGPIVD